MCSGASDNGVVVDMFSAEGFWLYQGPRDNADCNVHGTIFGGQAENGCFPTKTIAYHSKYRGAPSSTVSVPRARVAHNTIFRGEGADAGVDADADADAGADADADADARGGTFLFPDESFMRTAEALGFNRNDGILSLMPLMCYIHDE